MNGVIARSALFNEVFVQPVAHDAGAALGAALACAFELNPEQRGGPLRHLYYGKDLAEHATIESTLKRWAPILQYSTPDDIFGATATLLAEGGGRRLVPGAQRVWAKGARQPQHPCRSPPDAEQRSNQRDGEKARGVSAPSRRRSSRSARASSSIGRKPSTISRS